MSDFNHLLRELSKRQITDPAAYARKHVRKGLFPKQLAVLDDRSSAVAMQGGRRAGKTSVLVPKAMEVAIEHPGTRVPVMQLSRQSAAAREFQSILEDRCKMLRIELKTDFVTLSNKLPNGSSIDIVTGSDMTEISKLRGGKYHCVLLDEAQSFRPSVLEAALGEVIGPALVDYAGQVILAGTPGVLKAGVFYDVCVTGRPGWSLHKWTLYDNPYIENPHRAVESILQMNGWTKEHPTFLREFLGVWADDEDARCLGCTPANHVDAVPSGKWYYVLAVDPGVVDACGFVILAYDYASSDVYVVESFKRSGLAPTEVVAYCKELDVRYRFTRKVIDTGGQGKAHQIEAERMGFLFEPAKKKDKLGAITRVDGALRTGRLKVVAHANEELLEEMSLWVWDTRSTLERRPNPDCEDHLCHALIYGYNILRNPDPEPKGPAAPPKSLLELAAERHIERLMNPPPRKYLYER